MKKLFSILIVFFVLLMFSSCHPNYYAYIEDIEIINAIDGFYLVWKPVSGADQYNIYQLSLESSGSSSKSTVAIFQDSTTNCYYKLKYASSSYSYAVAPEKDGDEGFLSKKLETSDAKKVDYVYGL